VEAQGALAVEVQVLRDQSQHDRTRSTADALGLEPS